MEDEFHFVDLTTETDNNKLSQVNLKEEEYDDVVDLSPVSTVSTLNEINGIKEIKEEFNKQLLCLKLERKKVENLKEEFLKLNNNCKIRFKDLNNKLNENKDLRNKLIKELKLIKNERLQLIEDRNLLNKQIEINKKIFNKLNPLSVEFENKLNLLNKSKLNSNNNLLSKLSNLEEEFNTLKDSFNSENKKSTQQFKDVIYIERLDKTKAYSCKTCNVDVGLDGDIESRCYQVGQGTFTEKKRGYLFNDAVNLECGETKVENFTTGSYTIAWVNCIKCKQSMGWKYISAQSTENQSKVGKYCLSRYELLSPQERNENKN